MFSYLKRYVYVKIAKIGISPRKSAFLCLEILSEYRGDVLENAFGHVRLVHRVNVHVRDAVCIQVDNLVACVDDARLLHGIRIAAELINERLETLRHERTRKLDGAFDLVCVRDGHNAGQYRAVHACVAELVKEAEEKIVVKYHLRREEVRSCFNFFLEVLDIFGLVRAFRVLFGVAGGANAKVGVCCLDFADELNRMVVVAVAAAIRDKFRCEVAAESHDVFDAGILHVFDALVDCFLGARNASQVRKHRDVEVVLEVLCDFKRVLAHAATCAVRDAHECRVKLCNRFGSGFYVFKTRFFLRREHFKRKTHLVLLEDVDNLHKILRAAKGIMFR